MPHKGPTSRLRVVVLGYIIRGPLGGLAWHHLQYVMGFAQLGHDVYFVEDSDDFPACYDPLTDSSSTDPSYGLRFATDAFARVGLSDRWAYFDAHQGSWLGPAGGQALEVFRTADLIVNVSGVSPWRPWLTHAPARAFVDTDPVFTQIDHLTSQEKRSIASHYTSFFSFGENIANGRSTVPDDGLPWQPTRQPVVLDAWPDSPGPAKGHFTTVMVWESYPAREYRGRRYGMKSSSFRDYVDLPGKTDSIMELAIGVPPQPRAMLESKGWILRDPRGPSRDPWTYQQYIQQSKAEFGIAKHGYVVSRSGWFSERSAAYLASGRPILVQETGFSDWMRVDRGVVPFSSPEEARAAVEEINNRYTLHCRAAREIAEEYFDARRVLSKLLERALSSGSTAADRVPAG